MIIRITIDADISLDDEDDFKKFKISVNAPEVDFERIKEICPPMVQFLDARNALVLPSFVRDLAQPNDRVAWITKFEDMLDLSRRQGWVDEKSGMIKSHIEWVVDGCRK